MCYVNSQRGREGFTARRLTVSALRDSHGSGAATPKTTVGRKSSCTLPRIVLVLTPCASISNLTARIPGSSRGKISPDVQGSVVGSVLSCIDLTPISTSTRELSTTRGDHDADLHLPNLPAEVQPGGDLSSTLQSTA